MFVTEENKVAAFRELQEEFGEGGGEAGPAGGGRRSRWHRFSAVKRAVKVAPQKEGQERLDAHLALAPCPGTLSPLPPREAVRQFAQVQLGPNREYSRFSPS